MLPATAPAVFIGDHTEDVALVKEGGLGQTLKKPWKLLWGSEGVDLSYVCEEH